MNVILPIGSIVMIRNHKKPVMIFGFLQQSAARPGVVVDYVGVEYPLGNVNLAAHLGFQMTDITEVLFEGYRTEAFAPLEAFLLARQELHKQEAK